MVAPAEPSSSSCAWAVGHISTPGGGDSDGDDDGDDDGGGDDGDDDGGWPP